MRLRPGSVTTLTATVVMFAFGATLFTPAATSGANSGSDGGAGDICRQVASALPDTNVALSVGVTAAQQLDPGLGQRYIGRSSAVASDRDGNVITVVIDGSTVTVAVAEKTDVGRFETGNGIEIVGQATCRGVSS